MGSLIAAPCCCQTDTLTLKQKNLTSTRSKNQETKISEIESVRAKWAQHPPVKDDSLPTPTSINKKIGAPPDSISNNTNNANKNSV